LNIAPIIVEKKAAAMPEDRTVSQNSSMFLFTHLIEKILAEDIEKPFLLTNQIRR
jgi:hypothetical protein